MFPVQYHTHKLVKEISDILAMLVLYQFLPLVIALSLTHVSA